jgi:hypothetical protein
MEVPGSSKAKNIINSNISMPSYYVGWNLMELNGTSDVRDST